MTLHFWQEEFLGDTKMWCIDLTPWAMKLWGDDIIKSALYKIGTTKEYSADSIERIAKVIGEWLEEKNKRYKDIDATQEIEITFVNGKKMYLEASYNGATISS